MLDDSEAAEAEQSLRRILRQIGLTWVLTQVDEEFREGVTEDTSTQELSESAIDRLEYTTARISPIYYARPQIYHDSQRRKVLSSRPPTPTERVESLINAIERVTVELPKIEKEALHILVEQYPDMPEATSLSFIADVVSDAPSGLSLLATQDTEVRENIAAILSELREELRN